MIFLDKSGKRWKRIKRSTAGMVLLAALPVLALIAGSLIYQPQWSLLPLAKRASAPAPSQPTKPRSGSLAHDQSGSTPASSPTSAPGISQPRQQLTYQTGGASSIAPAHSTPASSPAPTTSATLSSAAPSPTPQPQSSTPATHTGNSDFGKSHKPTPRL